MGSVETSGNYMVPTRNYPGMARTPADKRDLMKKRLDAAVESGVVAEADGDRITDLCHAYDESKLDVAKPENESHRTARTIGGWYARLTTLAKRLDGRLIDVEPDAGEINQVMQELHDEKDLAKNTVRNYQNTARRFYRYHDDLSVDPDEIAVFGREEKGWGPEDVLTREEIDRVREAVDNTRDNLIFHLLLYTGQRSTALRTMRVKDVRPGKGETGRFRLNPEHGGLKKANQYGEWKPLLGAQGAVREWLRYHPDPEPENYLITGKPGYPKADPTTPVSRELLRRTMKELKEKTGIEKPMHPHMMRHNFVTIADRDYDMDHDVIKWIIGHAPDSRVMETTYSHLSDDDMSRRAEAAAGYAEPEEPESPLTPPSCPTCGNSLSADAAACEGCGEVFTPDAQAVERQVDEAVHAGAVEAEPGSETAVGVDTVREAIRRDPDLLGAAMADDELRDELLDDLEERLAGRLDGGE